MEVEIWFEDFQDEKLARKTLRGKPNSRLVGKSASHVGTGAPVLCLLKMCLSVKSFCFADADSGKTNRESAFCKLLS